jgi:putative endonuclease
MKTSRQTIGDWGEQQAAEYLRREGYEILGKNVRTPHGEIDLVAKLGDVTCFVEVRTLSSSRLARPEETINRRKKSHMMTAVEEFTQSHDIDHWQIDAISVEGRPGSQPVITHFENVLSDEL